MSVGQALDVVEVSQLKRNIARKIAILRGVPVSEEDVKINRVEVVGDKVVVEGEYEARSLFTGRVLEAGRFNAELDQMLDAKSITFEQK